MQALTYKERNTVHASRFLSSVAKILQNPVEADASRAIVCGWRITPFKKSRHPHPHVLVGKITRETIIDLHVCTNLPEELRAKLFACGPELLKRAINSVSESEEFQIPTPRNAACRVAALHTAEWLQAGNSAVFDAFL